MQEQTLNTAVFILTPKNSVNSAAPVRHEPDLLTRRPYLVAVHVQCRYSDTRRKRHAAS
jgi:hypothetical protein